jgi:hypothetical protein
VDANSLIDALLGETLNQLLSLDLEVIPIPPVNLTVGNYSVVIGNATINGLDNIVRLGDVSWDISPLLATLTSPLSIENVTVDLDIDVSMDQVNWQDGNVHVEIGDLSLVPVLTMETFPPALSLEDGMQLNVANVNVSVTGLGAVAQNDNVLIDGIISQSQTVAVLPLLSGVLGRTLSSALGTLGLPLNLLG